MSLSGRSLRFRLLGQQGKVKDLSDVLTEREMGVFLTTNQHGDREGEEERKREGERERGREKKERERVRERESGRERGREGERQRLTD